MLSGRFTYKRVMEVVKQTKGSSDAFMVMVLCGLGGAWAVACGVYAFAKYPDVKLKKTETQSPYTDPKRGNQRLIAGPGTNQMTKPSADINWLREEISLAFPENIRK